MRLPSCLLFSIYFYLTIAHSPRFVRRPEVANLKCDRLLQADRLYTFKNSFLHRHSLVPQPLNMSCAEIRKRIFMGATMFEPLESPFAIARNVYKDYEFHELSVAAHCHPDIHFCFVIDKNSASTFKRNMRQLERCVPTVHIASENLSLKSTGFNQNWAHYTCMKKLLQVAPQWKYLIQLQNNDILLKSTAILSDIFTILNGANDLMNETISQQKRINQKLDWNVSSLGLFPKGDPRNKAQLIFRAGLIQASLHRETIKWIVEKVNMTKLLDQFNWKEYGVDEFWLPTLHASVDLGMPGSIDDCELGVKLNRPLTRLDHWNHHYSPINCKSHFQRNSICILGVEDLPELVETLHFGANKVLPSFDWAVISCLYEHLFNGIHIRKERLSVQKKNEYQELRIVKCHRQRRLAKLRKTKENYFTKSSNLRNFTGISEEFHKDDAFDYNFCQKKSARNMKWRKGDVVMADWNGCFYKAKIINVSENDGETHYKIHYDSWSSKWDQVIPESETGKWEAFTAEAEEAARKQIKGVKARAKGRKRLAVGGGESDATPSAPKKEAKGQTSPLDFPETLKDILCDDYHKMTNLGLYIAMPAKVTVRQIIQEFCAKIAASGEGEMTVEVQYVDGEKVTKKTTKHEFTAYAHMMERLINSLFTRCLCVDRDKQQFQRLEDELLKIEEKNNNGLMKPFAPSEHFGVVYLLRLLVKINGDSNFIDACDHYSFFKHSSDLMKHLLDNIDNYYDKDAYNETDRSTA
ncbi:unnamed protein product, partial [Mesorhabditis belari]|uniref:Agenet domain-containing protein n=1 Tax=Mesorhabditis belari TaxID=2138241 RepID=A0AAF3EHK9_9BILA